MKKSKKKKMKEKKSNIAIEKSKSSKYTQTINTTFYPFVPAEHKRNIHGCGTRSSCYQVLERAVVVQENKSYKTYLLACEILEMILQMVLSMAGDGSGVSSVCSFFSEVWAAVREHRFE